MRHRVNGQGGQIAHSAGRSATLAFAGLSMAIAAPAAAQQDVPETEIVVQAFSTLDALSDASQNEQTGIQTATEQAGRGELLEALATLERVLATFPKSNGARVLHAVYLCDVDDMQGGKVELSKIEEKDVGAEAMAAARARCDIQGDTQ